MNAAASSSTELRILSMAQEIAERGKGIGLPLIATCADISSARPMTLRGGTPVPTLFEFARDARDYWRQGDLALQNAIVTIIRWTAEPFYYDRGVIHGWQPLRIAPQAARPGGPVPLPHAEGPPAGQSAALLAPLRYLNARAASILCRLERDPAQHSREGGAGALKRKRLNLHRTA